MTITMNRPVEVKKPKDIEACHLYCCNEDLALCGKDISTHKHDPNYDNICVVCLDLEDVPCSRCGE